eukprot:c18872_g1_i1.p1 GENE.c18872_g1_i1~~c18872_g1_i1.p1  ORF type:complete len:408 (+),score=118.22 c18872_g1_i1:35-1225(+)
MKYILSLIVFGLGVLKEVIVIQIESLYRKIIKSKKLPTIKIDDYRKKEVLSHALQENVKSVVVQEFVGVVGDDGTGTDRLQIDATLENGQNISYFLKVPAPSLATRAVLNHVLLYKNELNFYRNVAPHVENIIKMPKCYAAVSDGTRFLLILENVKQKNCKILNLLGSCTYEEAKSVLSSLASLHAKFWGKANTVAKEELRPGFCPGFISVMADQLKKKAPELFPNDVESLYRKFIENYSKVNKYWRSPPQTFVHGDAHNGNIYFYEDGSCGFLDFQVASREHPMRDVSYFLQLSCNTEFTEKYEKELIRYYLEKLYNAMAKQEKSTLKPEQILTFEDAWRMYRAQSLYTLTAFVFSGGAANFMKSRETVVELSRRAVGCVQRLKAHEVIDEIISK